MKMKSRKMKGIQAMSDKRILKLDKYEHGVLVNALNRFRTDLINEDQSTDAVDDVLIKAIDAPSRKEKRNSEEQSK